MNAALQPVTLQGSLVRLFPLQREHAAALWQAGAHPTLWALQPRPIQSLADMQAYVDTALEDQSRGLGLPWVTVDLRTDTIVGSTRLMDIALAHSRVEIGATWLSPTMQRSGINMEAKLLQFTHVFETLGLERVVFKTEAKNSASREAILKLGAVQEGIFMRHLRADDGRWRDMVYFAMLREQWPSCKQRLQERLARAQKESP